ncbi:MAG: hypothetical protein AB7P99_08050 [Vicinamibacterales bacterium]
MRPLAVLLAALALPLLAVGSPLRAQRVTSDTGDVMSRVAQYVDAYYSRAQSILAVETVRVQQVSRDRMSDGFARRFVYNLRVEWTPADGGPPEATLARELVSVNGRAPRPGDEPHCTAPRPITPEPLAMFLAERQGDFLFSDAEETRLDGRDLLRLDFRIKEPDPDVVSWDRECVTMEFPSRMRGRVWLDQETGEILRIDEGATGPVEVNGPPDRRRNGLLPVIVFDRSDTSIRYRPVHFDDPDEMLLLPERIESLTMSRTGGTRRTQTYSNYRRFVTGGRIVG